MANTTKPMYQKIKEDILHQIKTGLLFPGDKLPTEYQLMEQYKVSRITVSKALSELKSEGVIERFPNRGSFVSQLPETPPLAAELPLTEEKAGPTDRLPEIACIIPTVTDMFSLAMINGVLSAFPENEYICHIFQSRNPQIENYLLKRCLETDISGIVLFPQDQPFFSDELLFMNLRKYPLVLLDRHLPRLNTSYVIADNRMAGELCLRHLYELGHRRIAFITTSRRDTFSIRYRLEGIESTAQKLSMPESAIHVMEGWNVRKEKSHYRETLLKLINEDKVTAFITAENDACTYLYNLCTSLNLDIPGTISLMTFDTPTAEGRNPDFFTHINQSEFIMGREAGHLLRRRLEQNDMNIYRKVIMPSLEVRQSTAPAVP